MTALEVRSLAKSCGFELAGVAPATTAPDHSYYLDWIARGLAGEMHYLTDHRAHVRADPRNILPSAQTVIVVAKLYNTTVGEEDGARISRYARGDDYHDILRRDLDKLAVALGPDHEYRTCVDTAPLLERSLARAAGLGWIGKNTCLINQDIGSWLFLGELLTSLEIEPDLAAVPPPDRCGTCTRCIDACPTQALTPYELDATRCISYFTIELRGPIPDEFHAAIGNHVFGCDICQEVCPWNREAPLTPEPAFAPRHASLPLDRLATLTREEFREMFDRTPVTRARYDGFQRNVAIALADANGNSDATIGDSQRMKRQIIINGDPDAIEVLNDLSGALGGQVKRTRVMLSRGPDLTHRLRARYHDHEIELLANRQLMLIDVEARYGGFELLRIDPCPRPSRRAPACTLQACGFEHKVFTGSGALSHAQSALTKSGVIERLLEAIQPQEGEEINISQRLVRVWVGRPTAQRVMTIIRAVIDLMPHEIGSKERSTLPDTLRPLIPFVTKWAIPDDQERSRKLRRCAPSTRQKLASTVIPLIPAIDQFLDGFGENPSEEACRLGDLAQAALEAQSIQAEESRQRSK